MATMYPQTPVGTTTPEIIKVFRLLKRLPDGDYAVWQRLGIDAVPGPDFWVLHRSGRSVFLKVSTATPQDARLAYQHDLFAGTRNGLADTERLALHTFQSTVCAADATIETGQLPALIVFPAVPTADIRLAMPSNPYHAGRDECAAERFPTWLESQLGEPLNQLQIDSIRAIFAPEVIVPADLTVRQPAQRAGAARLTDYLLSYDQERALKSDLELSEEIDEASSDMGVSLVNGVAGSGKSLLIIYRTRLLRQFFPQKHILVLTHNRALLYDLQARYSRLTGDNTTVEWRTFMGWCQTHWPTDESAPHPIGVRRRTEIITEVWHRHLPDTTISARMFQEEIDWLKDRLLTTRQEYLAADRTGRGFGLNEAMRGRVFDAIADYRRVMNERGFIDWGDVPRRMWRALREGRSTPKPYDFILVDEAQFFAPIWFEIIKHILQPRGHLFMVADQTQGFLKRGQSWLASGLNVRGRSLRLEKSYRTTHEILDFATRMYQLRLPGDEEALVAPNLQQMPGGVPPQLIALDTEQDEAAQVLTEIRNLHSQGVPLEHILVLHAEWQGVDRMLERLRREFGEARVANPRISASGKHIRVCTLNAATGLESPIVFVMGTHHMVEAEQSLRLSTEERVELMRDNTRKLYMAFTRAGQRLAITYVGQLPAMFKQLHAPSVMMRDTLV